MGVEVRDLRVQSLKVAIAGMTALTPYKPGRANIRRVPLFGDFLRTPNGLRINGGVLPSPPPNKCSLGRTQQIFGRFRKKDLKPHFLNFQR